MNIYDLQKMKSANQKITIATCYDYWSAKIIADSDIDLVLVGDSLSMVMHGYNTTVSATMEMMILHTQAVARGLDNKLIIGDMPFLSYRYGLDESLSAVQKLMQAGAHAIKLEGASGNLHLIKHVVESGVPVMGHIGLTPQAINQLGGYKIQGKNAVAANQLIKDAQVLQTAGCFAIVLECVPSELAKTITEQLTIPTIGIGAGPHTSGQVLVLHDLLGLNGDFKPKFLKTYMDGCGLIKNALNAYCRDVKAVEYPAEEHCY